VHAPAPAIARFILESGGASSSEILIRFAISETTLRRRRPAIRRYGIVFVERGSGSYYAPADLEQLPDHLPPTALHKPEPGETNPDDTRTQTPGTRERDADGSDPREDNL
jgi:hypothetical protein